MLSEKNIKLIKASKNELDLIYNWRQTPDLITSFSNRDEISRDDHELWWNERKNAYDFIIYVNDKPVGITLLEQIDQRNRRCFWGIFIAEPSDRRQGIARRASNLCFQFAFDFLNMNKIYGTTLPQNKVGRNFHRSLGFIEEAVLKDYCFIDGAYSDLIYISMSNKAWITHEK